MLGHAWGMEETATELPRALASLATPAIQLDDVSRTFGSVVAVDGINLAVKPGEIVAFLGPNGAGKTTTIDMILGLSNPTSGDVSVMGLKPRTAIARGLVSAVMQSGGLLKDLTVRETVQYTASLFADTQHVDEVLPTPGITDIADRKVGKCSGGEQQRLRFAMALLPDPALLLLDEPTTGMDVEGRRTFWSAIRADAAAGPHGPVRDPLPRGGRPVRRPDRADQQGPDRRRRHRLGDQGARRPGAPSARPFPTPTPRPWARCPASRRSRSAATPCSSTRKDTDAVARHLLTQTAARDLEITARGLEDAFLSLTGDDDTTGRARRRPRDEHDRFDPTTRSGAAVRRLQPDRPRHRAQADAAQPAHDHLHAGLPGRPVLRVRRPGTAGTTRSRRPPGNVAAYIMVSMALYGAALTAAAGGAMVAMERSLGWSRQLRLTPLNPAVYILMKALIALVMGAIAVTVVNLAGMVQGKPSMPAGVWVACGVLTVVCTLVFAALVVFVGYLVPGENAMQILGPGLALLRVPRQRVHPARPRHDHVAHRLVHADVRGRRALPLAVDPRPPVVRRPQRGRLAGALRGRGRVADEQGHGAGLTGASVSIMSAAEPTRGSRRAPRVGSVRGSPPSGCSSCSTRSLPAGSDRNHVEGAAGDRGHRRVRSGLPGALVPRAPGPAPADRAPAAARLTRVAGCADRPRRSPWWLLLGEPGIACSVYVAVAGVLVLPFRAAAPLSLSIAAIVLVLGSLADWSSQIGTAFGVMAASVAIFGLRQVLARNLDLIKAHQENAQLAVENERNRFARDLHDILGHSLTVITVKAELAGRVLDTDPERARTELADLERLSRDALADVRRAVGGYREMSLSGELVRARDALRSAEIDAELPNSTDEVPGELQELFAWTVREGVTNVIRHSGASHCTVATRARRGAGRGRRTRPGGRDGRGSRAGGAARAGRRGGRRTPHRARRSPEASGSR